MPTKRNRVSRTPTRRVSAAAVDIYREALELKAGRDACLASSATCTHAECDRYRELGIALDRELGIRPWQCSPLDADAGPAPAGIDARAWHEARSLREVLDHAHE